MHRTLFLLFLALSMSSCSNMSYSTQRTEGSGEKKLKSSTKTGMEPVQKGTLANQKLVRDTRMGIASKVATLGCSNPANFQPYVLEMPKGDPGARVWIERWLVKGCGQTYPVRIRFRESGNDAANWTIE